MSLTRSTTWSIPRIASVMVLKAWRAYYRRMTRLLALLAAAALSAPASAAIYKWVDENGTTVYSNKPPEDVKLIKNAKIVVKDDEPQPGDAERAEAARQRQLEERVASLERQLAAAQQAPVQ